MMVDVAHKNEEAVMATLLKVDGTMGNTDEPFAFLDIRSMNGIEHKMNNDVCVEMTKIMEDVLGGMNSLTGTPRFTFGSVYLMGGIAIWDSKTRLWTVNGEECK